MILVALFAVQRTGTGRVSAFFGPITALWFVVLAVVGLINIIRDPSVLIAINPYYAISFLFSHGFIAFVTLGAVFLAVTGAEALYADLGHFGRRPIQLAWYGLVFPALMLNYFGQGALVLSDPSARENPFFLLFPEWALIPAVILATAATVIASQAVISGAYSLTRQAIQLGLLPRMRILFTSETTTGQIYIPRINWLLFAAVVVLTFSFGSSANLAAAYGIAVTATMVVDALLAIVVLQYCWHWQPIDGHRRDRPVRVHRRDLSRREQPEDRPRRLDADPVRRRADRDDADVASRHRHPCREGTADRSFASRTRHPARRKAAAPRAGHRDLPDRRSGGSADRAPAQSEAQQDHSRAQHHHDDPHRADAARSRRAARHDRASCRRPSSGSR